LLIVAVGIRMPHWVCDGYEEFARRMPRELALELVEIKPEPRSSGKPLAALLAAEAARIAQALPARCRRVVLDERGQDMTTQQLAGLIETWMGEGEDVAFIIGGADGLAPEVKAAARATLRLSSLTLPHALVRVVLAEQLYRAVSLLRNHPYHRD
jgi:23S rRNA (pseudouridine1915-N3)-methyltransferase